MSEVKKSLYAKGSGMLQIPYQDYLKLVEKVEQGRRIKQVKDVVLENLSRFLDGKHIEPVEGSGSVTGQQKPTELPKVELEVTEQQETSVEVEIEEVEIAPAEDIVLPEVKEEEPSVVPRKIVNVDDVPPLKESIANHFNKLDESGRLFSVFKQYYTCLNDTCGGTVRVTFKDGFCSFWNYDAWEEFAYVDIHEEQLRIGLAERYTEDLKTLNLCEVPRLLASRYNLVCVQVDDLNKRILEVMTKAFSEAGVTTH
jgi:hypothetical protein